MTGSSGLRLRALGSGGQMACRVEGIKESKLRDFMAKVEKGRRPEFDHSHLLSSVSNLDRFSLPVIYILRSKEESFSDPELHELNLERLPRAMIISHFDFSFFNNRRRILEFLHFQDFDSLLELIGNFEILMLIEDNVNQDIFVQKEKIDETFIRICHKFENGRRASIKK